MKTLIKNVDILSMTKKEKILKNQNILIENKNIIGIGEIPLNFKADNILDGNNHIALPGFINTHTHSAMSLLRSYADDLPLSDWLTKYVFPIENKFIPDDVYWGTMLSIAEMISSGITCFNDMYFFEEKVAEAVSSTKIRARLANGLATINEDHFCLEKAISLYKNWHNSAEGRITIMLAPHAPYTCSLEFLKEIIVIAKNMNIGIHIHLSETRQEVEDSLQKYGKSPIELMEAIGLFDVPTIAAHCVHLSKKDIEILSRKKVNVSNNPGSNLKLGNGIAPVSEMIIKGINVSLGTDGACSNNNLNMMEEINLVALINKGVTENPTIISAYTALKMATINGAKALGLQKEIGTLEVNKKADIILIDTDKAHFYPKINLISSLVYSAQASDIDTVIVDGNILMEKRELTSIDLEEVIYNVNKSVKRLI